MPYALVDTQSRIITTSYRFTIATTSRVAAIEGREYQGFSVGHLIVEADPIPDPREVEDNFPLYRWNPTTETIYRTDGQPFIAWAGDVDYTGMDIIDTSHPRYQSNKQAVIYYVNPTSGDNSRNGFTAQNAWKTIDYALSQFMGSLVIDVELRIQIVAGFHQYYTVQAPHIAREITGIPATLGSGLVSIYGDPAAPLNYRISALAIGGATVPVASITPISATEATVVLSGAPDLSLAYNNLSRLTVWGAPNAANEDNRVAKTINDATDTIVWIKPNSVSQPGAGGSAVITTPLVTIWRIRDVRGFRFVINGLTVEGGRGTGSIPGGFDAGLTFQRCDATVRNSVLRYSGCGLSAIESSSVTMDNCQVYYNFEGIRADRQSTLITTNCTGDNFGRIIAADNSIVVPTGITGRLGDAQFSGGKVQR